MFDINSPSINILTSRDGIRNQLVDYAKSYLELENVDLYYTSFLSYIINVLSVLTSNQLYYTSTIYREFFLTEAQLEESVYNLVKWIGYTPSTATPAKTDILMTLPLKFKDNDVTFKIPNNFKVKSGDIIYTIDSPLIVKLDKDDIQSEEDDMDNEGINIRVLNNKAVTVRNDKGYFFPVLLDSKNETASFMIPFTQYEIHEFTYQVPEDLEIYQFWSVTLEYSGMAWTQKVYEVYDDGSGTVTTLLQQAEANSLYTMTSHDKKYVFVPSYNKADIYFGNGIIGKQPTPGSTIKIEVLITKGESGRVITGALNQSDKLYYSAGGKTLPIKLTVTNPSPALGGEDAPSISQIKSRAIANLTSKERFVSEQDYNDLEDILPQTPLADSVPILKRSDIKINEIMLFTKLKYQDMICPTRNITLGIDTSSYLVTDIIPAGTIVDVDGEDYETLFTLQPQYLENYVQYQYIINEINTTPVLEINTDYSQYCYIIMTNVNYKKNNDEFIVTAQITEIPDEVTDFECTLITDWDGRHYPMTLNIDVSGALESFTYIFPSYLTIPLNKQTFRFNITGMWNGERKPISTYVANTIVRKNLDDFMMSSMTVNSPTQYLIHNVPVIRHSYFADEDINRPLFELLTLQKLIYNIDINSRKMLTDFINIKFSDTTGKLNNMKYNTPTKGNVISKTQTLVPSSPLNEQQWLVNGTEDPSWFNYKNYIAIWYDVGGWTFIKPSVNDSVYVIDENKSYVYTSCEWIEPIFDIPFEVKAIVTKDPNSPISSSILIENIKNALLNTFVTKFGLDRDIDKSEILSVIRSVDGVTYVKLQKPEIDIRFKFNVEDLTLNTLLDYTPQLVAFTYDNITISIKEE